MKHLLCKNIWTKNINSLSGAPSLAHDNICVRDVEDRPYVFSLEAAVQELGVTASTPRRQPEQAEANWNLFQIRGCKFGLKSMLLFKRVDREMKNCSLMAHGCHIVLCNEYYSPRTQKVPERNSTVIELYTELQTHCTYGTHSEWLSSLPCTWAL